MASPYGRTNMGTDQAATAGYSNAEVMDMLDNGIRAIPVQHRILALSPVWLRTEQAHPCLLQPVPPAPLTGEYQEAPTSAQAAFDDNDPPTGADERLIKLKSLYPALTASELEAVKDQAADVLDVDEDLREEFLRDTQNAAETIRNFLFKNIAPIAVGSGIAFDDFNQELKAILGAEASANFSPVKQMMEDAMTMKTFEFLSQELNLSPESSRNVLAVFLAKRVSPSAGRNQGVDRLLKELLNATKDA